MDAEGFVTYVKAGMYYVYNYNIVMYLITNDVAIFTNLVLFRFYRASRGNARFESMVHKQFV